MLDLFPNPSFSFFSLNFIPNAYRAFAFQVPLFWVLFSLCPCTLHHGFYVPTSKESTWGSLVGLGGLEKQLWFIVCRCAKLVQRFFEKETKKHTSIKSLSFGFYVNNEHVYVFYLTSKQTRDNNVRFSVLCNLRLTNFFL